LSSLAQARGAWLGRREALRRDWRMDRLAGAADDAALGLDSRSSVRDRAVAERPAGAALGSFALRRFSVRRRLARVALRSARVRVWLTAQRDAKTDARSLGLPGQRLRHNLFITRPAGRAFVRWRTGSSKGDDHEIHELFDRRRFRACARDGLACERRVGT